ncbi:MAG: NPCBM/NEW2 domain-containing protein, partial [Verrucomicrobia bacterium]|nr:NPCBM/NEW2 domain-containing protein [Verrucomicrobiota bacterium]
MDLSKAYQQYGELQVNKSVTGESVYAAGTSYSDAIGVHSQSVIKLDLKKNALRFKGLAGVSDSKIDYKGQGITTVPLADGKRVFYHTLGNEKFFAGIEGENGTVDRGEVVFRVLGDGRELYASGIIVQGDAPQEIDLDLKGVEILELIVEPGEKGPSGDHALWIHPVIEYSGEAPTVVDADYMLNIETGQSQIQQRLQSIALTFPAVEWPLARVSYDWLIHSENSKTGVYSADRGTSLVLANDLVARVFKITPDLATVDIVNRMTEENMLRAVSPEGYVSINGVNYSLGGLSGQPERGYIKREWLEQMQRLTNSFHIVDFEISDIQESIHWARSRWALNKAAPTGKVLTFVLEGPEKIKSVTVKLHYALYDHLPVIKKSMEVFNGTEESIKVDSFKLESLAFSEPESPVEETRPYKFRLPNIHVESNYCFHGFTEKEADKTENWVVDPNYSSQCNYPRVTPCILEVNPPMGPDEVLEPGNVFHSFDVYEMPMDSDDRERQGLFKRRMYTTIAPWVTENPIFLHLTSTDPEVVKRAVDQCAEVGYEMIILSFGSGLNMEKTEEEYYNHFKEFVDYAKSKGIEMGGYSLLSSRWISDEVEVINPQTGKRG